MKTYFLILLLVSCIAGDTDKAGTRDSHEDDSHEDDIYTAVCTPYCDIYGYKQAGKTCYSPIKPVYCCGNENYRYCCDDPSYSIDGIFPPVQTCPRTSWWIFHWRLIIGLLGSLMAVLLVSACCYYCCITLFRDKTVVRRVRRRTDVPAVSADIEQESRPRLQLMFDPDSPNAFFPPAYDTLAKEPPKYSDVFQGRSNDGFVIDENNVMSQSHEINEPPPCYEPPNLESTNAANEPINDNVTREPTSAYEEIHELNPLYDNARENENNK